MAREPTRILVPAYDFPGPADLGETPRDWDVLASIFRETRAEESGRQIRVSLEG